ncbi:MAG TPA: DUF4169 family protein [Alphaproteobacteria bacterium]|jgi:hypothetical protein
MGDIVSLRDFRKKKAQEERERKAAENRARFGRTREQKERDRREEQRRVDQLEGKKRGGALIPVPEEQRPNDPQPPSPKADDA